MPNHSSDSRRTPQFPPAAFIGMITLLSPTKSPGLFYPLMRLYTRNADYFSEAKKQRTRNPENVGETGIIIPVSFSHTLPLKPDYWESPEIHFDHMDRARLFSTSLLHPHLYDVLITPSGVKKGTEEFLVAIPVLRYTKESTIERFMQSSDFPVDQKATAAALYQLEEPIGVNILTMEFLKHGVYPKNKAGN